MVRLLRGAGLPLVPSPTRHRGIVVLTVRPGNPVNTVIEGFLMALRVGSLPMGPITLARPFNAVATLGEYAIVRDGARHRAYCPCEVLNDVVPRLLQPMPRAVRVRARARGLGFGNWLREYTKSLITKLGIRHSERSSLVLNVEAVWIGGDVKLYIGYFPRWLMIRYGTARYLRERPVGRGRATGGLVPRAY